ncbi:hypothetical protein ABZ609_00375 [Streptomyces rubiginosohelvolus]
MSGPPPCAYGQPCGYDDKTNTCRPCTDDTPPEHERPIENVPTGSYL